MSAPDRGNHPRRRDFGPTTDFVAEPPHHIGEDIGLKPYSNYVPYLMEGHGPQLHWNKKRGWNQTDYPRAEDWGQTIEDFVPKKLPMDGQFKGYH